MTADQEAAKTVLKWATQGYTTAIRNFVQSEADEVGRQAAQRYWDKCHPDDGVGSMSSNPYTGIGDRGQDAIERARGDLLKWEQVHQFVSRRLCEMISDDEEKADE